MSTTFCTKCDTEAVQVIKIVQSGKEDGTEYPLCEQCCEMFEWGHAVATEGDTYETADLDDLTNEEDETHETAQ